MPINASTVQVTNEGLARSLGYNRASDLNLPEEWDTTSSRYAYKGAIVSTVKSGNTYTVTFGQGGYATECWIIVLVCLKYPTSCMYSNTL